MLGHKLKCHHCNQPVNLTTKQKHITAMVGSKGKVRLTLTDYLIDTQGNYRLFDTGALFRVVGINDVGHITGKWVRTKDGGCGHLGRKHLHGEVGIDMKVKRDGREWIVSEKWLEVL